MDFDERLEKYAELIVKTGVNVQKGQPVILYISVDQAKLARLIVAKAYETGAGRVFVKWRDDFINRKFIENASEEFLNDMPDWEKAEGKWIADEKAARISVISSDPNALSGVDAKRVSAWNKTCDDALEPVMDATINHKLAWTVVGAASPAWAKQVFPELDEKAATERLWKKIFDTARVTEDPVKEWERHAEKLHEKAAWLNEEQFKELHYTSPVTDLTIGLPKNHYWAGGSKENSLGIKFMANMPTEEVFTAPDNRRINGYVTATKPLSYAGNILEGMRFSFKDGKVVEATAEKGQDVLDELLKNAGADSLGEVSLVPDESPISQSGIIFYNTLYDENASDHLALGAAYPFNVQGGREMSNEELLEHGVNVSKTHVDFMVGSSEMNIDGIKEDGTVVPVFRNGNWA